MADAFRTNANSKCTMKIRLACTVAKGGTEGEDPARIEIVQEMGEEGEERQLEGLAIMESQ